MKGQWNPVSGNKIIIWLVSDAQGLPAKKMEELAFEASDKVYGKEDSGPYEALR